MADRDSARGALRDSHPDFPDSVHLDDVWQRSSGERDLPVPVSIRLAHICPISGRSRHYRDILGISDAGRRSGLNFGRNLANTLIVSTAVVISSLVFNTMGAYFFARLKFPKKNWLLAFVLITLFVPFEVTMVPLYIVVHNLHLQNSYWAMIVPWFAGPSSSLP